MRGESARLGTKRPLRALSASEKMEAIQRVHDGESKASVARDIGVPESTLRGWCKSEHKIRGMARNSSTPESEAHSPASSSGANHLISNLSSEDEGVMGPTSSKKMRLDGLGSGASLGHSDGHSDGPESGKHDGSSKQPKMDYMSSIINSLVAGGVRSDNSSILLQQLGLFSSAQSAASLTKNLLGLSANGLGSSHGSHGSHGVHGSGGGGSHGSHASHGGSHGSHGSHAAQQAVGLVENGLQYTKSSLGHSSGKRHSSSSLHISAIAPTTQLDSVSKSRKSLPPAAEAPSTLVPASPRKSGEHHNGGSAGAALGLQHHQLQAHSRSSAGSKRGSSGDNGLGGGVSTGSSSSSSARKADEALWLWLAQQQQLLGHQAAAAAAPFNPSASGVDGSWFWQWYKQCSFPVVNSAAAAALTAPGTGSSASSAAQQQQQQQQAAHMQSSSSRKSPSKAKALLDNVLCNNNNESVRRSLNGGYPGAGGLEDEEGAATATQSDSLPMDLGVGSSTEEAIEHGEKFFKWLDKCSEPSVTRLQILQFKYLLDNLKTCRKKTPSFKQSRK